MNSNLKALVRACQTSRIKSEINHPSGNLLTVYINKEKKLFANWSTPMNEHSIMHLCNDKDYFYNVFVNTINMPLTQAFLDPDTKPKYSEFLEFQTQEAIANEIEDKFQYPVIVKSNRGSLGKGVFLATSREELTEAISSIFGKNSSIYDYILLAQQVIDIKDEFRVIYLHGEHMFSYRKDQSEAKFTGNLSPLHWEGARSELVTKQTIIQDISRFCAPLFTTIDIPFCGLDVALDHNNTYWLIEANSSPSFDNYITCCGDAEVIDLYTKMLSSLADK